MAQPKKVAWSEVRVGLLVIASFSILVIAIFFISGKGGVFAGRYHIVTYMSAASGLKEGAPVWLAGVEVGKVDSVTISNNTDPAKSVEIRMSVRKSYADDIRTDSEARLGSIGLLGDKYIELSRGFHGQPVAENGEVRGMEEADIKRLMESANDLLANLDVLSDKVKSITEKIDRGEGSVGKFINDPALYDNVSHTAKLASDMMEQIKNGQGSIGKMLQSDEFYNHLNGVVDKLEKVANRLDAGEGSLGKFMKDDKLYNNANQTVEKAKNLMDRIEKGEGTMGKLVSDQQLYNRLNNAVEKLSAVADKLDKGEGTMGKLMNDKALYDNLNQASAEIVKLIYDFRQNPKKFMTIKLKVF
ncbi:MAG: MlaD family protein [Acidobacteriia bacterium]|nr:MlaD family protein [Terriglobia bacterium]